MGVTKIEWTATVNPDGTTSPGYTFNPWSGCQKVSPGCQHCYAETMAKRNPTTLGIWGPTGARVRMSDAYWRKPLKWNEQAEKEGRRYRVFCASMADVFEDRPELAGWRLDLFRLIVHTRNLDWLLLTKRPENIVSMMDSMGWPFMLANAWVGTTVENQEQADRRIPQLLAVPAVVRFLSCEPLLGPVDLSSIPDALYDTGMPFSWNKLGGDERGIKWVIAGGESGHGARPMHPDWVRSLRDQCQAAGVPFFFKQWGEWLPGSHFSITEHTDMSRIMQFGDGQIMQRVGKKQSGRLLAGVEWNQFPGGEA